jgi:hypothetical protein
MKITSISKLPNSPAVYAMYGGHARERYVAYVGVADKLKRRIIQHLINRDSSIATGTSTAGLNPEYVTEVRWWEHHSFSKRNALIAAELIAFQVFDPALRSRGKVPKKALEIQSDEEFRAEMTSLFKGEPKDTLIVPSLQNLADTITILEQKIALLEKRLNQLKKTETKP